MQRKTTPLLLFYLACYLFIVPKHLEAQGISVLGPLKKEDRLLILAPHPDDEAIACAGIIQQAKAIGAQVKIAYLTNGDHNQVAFIVYEKRLTVRSGEFIHMGQVRRKEAIQAMKLFGLSEKDLVFLGYPDFGTFIIFSKYWQSKKPFKSLLTRVTNVPYQENLSFGAPYDGEHVLLDLKKVLLDYKPTRILVSHPADTNGDHKALYLFLQIALWDLDKDFLSTKTYPYLVHCVGWPLPRRYHPELNLEPPLNFRDSQINWFTQALSPAEVEKKHKAILCYKSQTESSAFYLLAFCRKNELVGDYPKIELTRQISVKEQAVSFFGFSSLYPNSNTGILGGLNGLIENEGEVSYAVVDSALLIRIEKMKGLSRGFNALLYLFGYSHKTPFNTMPKIRIMAKYKKVKVFDAGKPVKQNGVSVELISKGFILRVPLALLGDPERILTSIKAYGGYLPVDATGFRSIEIK